MEIAILALGCFWGPEKKFGKIEGIVETEVGYCGGKMSNTSYREVCTGETEHAEVVKLTFDPKKISYEQIIEYFFHISFTSYKPSSINTNLMFILFMVTKTSYKSNTIGSFEMLKDVFTKISNPFI